MYNLKREDYVSDFSFKRECLTISQYFLELSEYYKKDNLTEFPIQKEIEYCENCIKCDYYQDVIGLRCINCGIIKLETCDVTLTDDVIALILSFHFRKPGMLTLSKSIRSLLISNHIREYLTLPIKSYEKRNSPINSDGKRCYYQIFLYENDRLAIKNMIIKKYQAYLTDTTSYASDMFKFEEFIDHSGRLKLGMLRNLKGDRFSRIILDIKSIKTILEKRAEFLDCTKDYSLIVNKIITSTYLHNVKFLSGNMRKLYIFMNAYSFGELNEENAENLYEDDFKKILKNIESYHEKIYKYLECDGNIDNNYIIQEDC